MAYLVQILIPVTGTAADARRHAAVRAQLVEHFGGVTAWNRAPASGLWKQGRRRSRVVRDDIVVYEVLSARLQRRWWKRFADQQKQRFDQTALVLYAHPVHLLSR